MSTARSPLTPPGRSRSLLPEKRKSCFSKLPHTRPPHLPPRPSHHVFSPFLATSSELCRGWLPARLICFGPNPHAKSSCGSQLGCLPHSLWAFTPGRSSLSWRWQRPDISSRRRQGLSGTGGFGCGERSGVQGHRRPERVTAEPASRDRLCPQHVNRGRRGLGGLLPLHPTAQLTSQQALPCLLSPEGCCFLTYFYYFREAERERER